MRTLFAAMTACSVFFALVAAAIAHPEIAVALLAVPVFLIAVVFGFLAFAGVVFASYLLALILLWVPAWLTKATFSRLKVWFAVGNAHPPGERTRQLESY